eukprot:GHVL01013970.1.p3 GENE.GHVL01013970.1~~GHVL01013970.1.p3  ORF type:complete len:144 (-),score=38.86 GHVL01013970.1:650-1081(-)
MLSSTLGVLGLMGGGGEAVMNNVINLSFGTLLKNRDAPLDRRGKAIPTNSSLEGIIEAALLTAINVLIADIFQYIINIYISKYICKNSVNFLKYTISEGMMKCISLSTSSLLILLFFRITPSRSRPCETSLKKRFGTLAGTGR